MNYSNHIKVGLLIAVLIAVLIAMVIIKTQYFGNQYVVAMNPVNVYSKPYPNTAKLIGGGDNRVILVLAPGGKLRIKSQETKSYRVYTVDLGEQGKGKRDGYVIYNSQDLFIE